MADGRASQQRWNPFRASRLVPPQSFCFTWYTPRGRGGSRNASQCTRQAPGTGHAAKAETKADAEVICAFFSQCNHPTVVSLAPANVLTSPSDRDGVPRMCRLPSADDTTARRPGIYGTAGTPTIAVLAPAVWSDEHACGTYLYAVSACSADRTQRRLVGSLEEQVGVCYCKLPSQRSRSPRSNSRPPMPENGGGGRAMCRGVVVVEIRDVNIQRLSLTLNATTISMYCLSYIRTFTGDACCYTIVHNVDSIHWPASGAADR